MRSRGEGDIERRRGRCDHPTSGTIDDRDRVARRTHTACRSTSGAIVRRALSSIDERRAHSSIAPLIGMVRSSDERCDRQSVLSNLGSLFSLSLSLIWVLSSLSLTLFPEMN